MRGLFKWLLIRSVVGGLVSILAIATMISLIVWFFLWPVVYVIKLISVNIDRKGEFISKKRWDDWFGKTP